MKKNKYTATKKNSRPLLFIITIVFILAWTGFDVYRTYTAKKEKDKQSLLSIEVKPISAKFNLQIIETLKNRKTFTQQELENVPEITSLYVLQTAPEATPQSMPVQETATASGQLTENE